MLINIRVIIEFFTGRLEVVQALHVCNEVAVVRTRDRPCFVNAVAAYFVGETRSTHVVDRYIQFFADSSNQCISLGLVTGECVVGDGSYLPANVSSYSQVKLQETVKRGMQSYLVALDEELEKEPGFRSVEERTQSIQRTTSQTDPDCG